MKQKQVKKKIFIREYDYVRLERRAKYLYDKVSFEPVTADWFKKQHTWLMLKGDKRTAHDYRHWQYPDAILDRLKGKLHDKSYLYWLVKYDDDGYLTIRSRLNAPESRMGWATLEKFADESPE